MKNLLNYCWQSVLPQHQLSRLGGKIADCTNPTIKNYLCRLAIKHLAIDLSEANSPRLEDYPSFNDFFDRYLLAHARPIDGDKQTIVSPADGLVSQCGKIKQDPTTQKITLIQAKNKDYSLDELIHDKSLSQRYEDGYYATIYLSPRDYHRVHSPLSGTLVKSEYLPGSLFAVNHSSANAIEHLFTRNERLICHLDTLIGQVIVVFVGALFVNGIRTQWLEGKPPRGIHPLDKTWFFSKGSELGLFRFGSTVILIFPPNSVTALDQYQGKTVKMGQALGQITQ